MLVLVRIAAIVGVAGIAAMPRAARGAQPIPKAAPQIESHEPALHCGVLPRGSDAFKTCIDAESRRDALKFGEPIMPVFSSR